MNRNKIPDSARVVSIPIFFCLLILCLFLPGCSYHDQHYSFSNMLDEQQRTQRNRQAAEKFWSSVRPVSTLPDSQYKLGLHYLQQGEYRKAIVQFSKTLHNNSDYCKAYNGIAMAHDALKQCEPAHNAYEQALRCAPDQAYIYNNYACSSLLCGDRQKGIALLRKAEKLDEENARIHNNLIFAETAAAREMFSDTLDTQHSSALASTTELQQPEAKQLTLATETLSTTPQKAVLADEHGTTMPEDALAKTPLSPPTRITVFTPHVIERLSADKSKRVTLQNSPFTAPDYAEKAIEIANGNGVTGMAGRSADFLRGYGFNVHSITNAENFGFQESVIYYKDGYLPVAKELVALIPGVQNLRRVDSFAKASVGVRILLGKDLAGRHFPESYLGSSRIQRAQIEYVLASTTSVSPLQGQQ